LNNSQRTIREILKEILLARMNRLENKTIDFLRRDSLQKTLVLNMQEQCAYNPFQQRISDAARVFLSNQILFQNSFYSENRR
jgi:hypothetical protein